MTLEEKKRYIFQLTDQEILEMINGTVDANTLTQATRGGVKVPGATSIASRQPFDVVLTPAAVAVINGSTQQIMAGADPATISTFVEQPFFLVYMTYGIQGIGPVPVGSAITVTTAKSNGNWSNIDVTINSRKIHSVSVLGPAAPLQSNIADVMYPFPLLFQSLYNDVFSNAAAGNVSFSVNLIGEMIFTR